MTARTATKSPDDKPFDFNLDTVEAEVDLSPWRVHWGGKRWEFQHAENLDVWRLLEGAEQGDVGATVAVFKVALGPDQWDQFKKISMPQYKMKALFDAYKKYCGLGESEASSSS